MRILAAQLSFFFTALVVSTASAAPPRFELNVIENGQTPRVLYEYEPKAGAFENLEIRVEHDQKVASGAMEREIILPVMIAEAEIAIDRAPLAAGVGASVSIEALRSETREGVPPELMPHIEQAIGQFQPVAGRVEATPSGRVDDFTLTASAGVPQALSQSATQITGSLQSMLVPLPESPVGVGAKWEVVSEIPEEQYTITQTTTYTVDRIDDHRLALSVEIEQEIPGDVSVSDVSGGWEGSVTEFYGVGSGTVIISLKQLSPLHSDLGIASRIIIDAEANGQQARSGFASTTRVVMKGEIVK